MSNEAKYELDQLLEVMRAQGYQPIGILFRDPKLNLLGIAPIQAVPDKWVEMIGSRLGGMNGKTTWTTVHES